MGSLSLPKEGGASARPPTEGTGMKLFLKHILSKIFTKASPPPEGVDVAVRQLAKGEARGAESNCFHWSTVPAGDLRPLGART